jgi:hypothetical protein
MADPQGGPDSTSGAIPPSSGKKAPVRKNAAQKAPAVPAKKVPAKKVPAKKVPAEAATESAQPAAPASEPLRAQTAAVPGQSGVSHVVGIPTAVTSAAEPTDVKAIGGSAARIPIRIPLAIGLTAASLGAMLIRRLRRH